jgi:hypothetical protein
MPSGNGFGLVRFLRLNVLLRGIGLEVFRGLLVGQAGAKSLLKKLAGVQAIAAGVAFGLDRGFAVGQDHDFDDSHCSFLLGVVLGIERCEGKMASNGISVVRAHPRLKLGNLAFEPNDFLVGFFDDVKGPFEPCHLSSKIQMFPLETQAKLVDFGVDAMRREDRPNDAATWRGHVSYPR